MATHSSVLAWRILWTEGAWWAAIYGVAQSRTRLRRLSSSSSQSCLPLCYSSNTWKPHLKIWVLCSFWLESLLHDIPLAYPFPPLSSLLQSQLPSENFSLFSMPHLLPTLPTATFYLFFSCPVCLGWVFVAVCRIFSSYGQRGLPQVRAQASPYGGFSRCGAPALGHLASRLRSRGSRPLQCRLRSGGTWRTCPVARGIFLDQGPNPYPLHCKALPALDCQGSPLASFSLALVFIWYAMLLLLLSGFSPVWLCENLWTAACQAPLPMEFSRLEWAIISFSRGDKK